MFAIFLHESMTTFYQIISSFPTVIYTVPLIVCIAYWLVAVLGMVDIEILDIDMDGDIDAADSAAAQSGIAGLLMRLGLTGVPLTVIVTLIAAIGWLSSYYTVYYLQPIIPDLLIFTVPFKLGTLFTTLIFSTLLTAQIIKPIRALVKKLDIDETKHIVGQTITVRSGTVDQTKGEGVMDDGGAGLILNIRSSGNDTFKKGDLVVAIEEINDQNLYRVISRSEFDKIENKFHT